MEETARKYIEKYGLPAVEEDISAILEESEKERMRLSMKEEQAIPELRKSKEKWKKLYEEGKDKDRYERRALLRQMNRIEGEIFKGEFWNKIEGTLTSEKLMDIMVAENFNEKRVLTKISEVAKISDKHVLDAIDQLPDEELDAVWGKEIERF